MTLALTHLLFINIIFSTRSLQFAMNIQIPTIIGSKRQVCTNYLSVDKNIGHPLFTL